MAYVTVGSDNINRDVMRKDEPGDVFRLPEVECDECRLQGGAEDDEERENDVDRE